MSLQVIVPTVEAQSCSLYLQAKIFLHKEGTGVYRNDQVYTKIRTKIKNTQ